MSILKYQIEDESQGAVSVWIDTKSEKVIVETELNLIECSFQDWQKLTLNIAKDIEAYQESKPKDLFFGYQIVKK
jgi:hypothetical protein